MVGILPFILWAIGIASLVLRIILMNLLTPLAGIALKVCHLITWIRLVKTLALPGGTNFSSRRLSMRRWISPEGGSNAIH
jgi:hypothetical protein